MNLLRCHEIFGWVGVSKKERLDRSRSVSCMQCRRHQVEAAMQKVKNAVNTNLLLDRRKRRANLPEVNV